jgi:hypothetical protein
VFSNERKYYKPAVDVSSFPNLYDMFHSFPAPEIEKGEFDRLENAPQKCPPRKIKKDN